MGTVWIGAETHYTATCPTCKVNHTLPSSLHEAAQARAGELSVYCPNGHSWVYKSQAIINREEELRLERDRLKQQLAWKDDEIKRQRDGKEHERRQKIALKGILTKTKKRISVGVCPCCNRTFQNLASHMATQHKDFALETPDEPLDSLAGDDLNPQPPVAPEPPRVHTPAKPPEATGKVKGCSVAGCKGAIHSRGMCSKHYQQDYQRRRRGQAA